MKNTYQDKLGYKKGRQLEQGRIPSDAALLGLPKGNATQTTTGATITEIIVTIHFQKG